MKLVVQLSGGLEAGAYNPTDGRVDPALRKAGLFDPERFRIMRGSAERRRVT